MSTTKAVIVSIGDEHLVVEVEIRLPLEAAGRLHVNEAMILSTLASGRPQTFYSRHGQHKTLLTPMTVAPTAQEAAQAA